MDLTTLAEELLNIDYNYIDGASLTHGEPREHICTFAVASRGQNCGTPPAAVGD